MTPLIAPKINNTTIAQYNGPIICAHTNSNQLAMSIENRRESCYAAVHITLQYTLQCTLNTNHHTLWSYTIRNLTWTEPTSITSIAKWLLYNYTSTATINTIAAAVAHTADVAADTHRTGFVTTIGALDTHRYGAVVPC